MEKIEGDMQGERETAGKSQGVGVGRMSDAEGGLKVQRVGALDRASYDNYKSTMASVHQGGTCRPRTFHRRILSEHDILQKRGPLLSDSFESDSPLSSFARSFPCALLKEFTSISESVRLCVNKDRNLQRLRRQWRRRSAAPR